MTFVAVKSHDARLTAAAAAASDEMTDVASPSLPSPPPPPPPPQIRHGVPAAPTAAGDAPKTTPTPRWRMRRLQWVKIPAGRVAGGGRNVWMEVGDRFGSSGSPPKLDFAEMEELFRVAEPSPASVNGVVRRQSGDCPSDDVSTVSLEIS